MVTMLPVSAARLKDHLRRSRNGAGYMRLEALISCPCPGRKPSQRKSLDDLKEKKDRLIKLIHESPRLHDINRASWSLSVLATVYERLYGGSISKSSISEYFQASGYKFKKAKKMLTSSDPEYREKLSKITQILSELTPSEKFSFN
jgi:transposase